ncbi:uncharacterized protein [Hyperolius riggenbachi]|uniref:uncharacterized protein n=1 Tax=Hyperolius riggenbachi TaxID=752182 RepID=UPI0035A2E6A5
MWEALSMQAGAEIPSLALHPEGSWHVGGAGMWEQLACGSSWHVGAAGMWEELALSSLKCLQCLGTSSSCRMVAKKCPSYETTCISLTYQTQAGAYGTNTVMKGCASTQLCNQTSIIDSGNHSMYMTSTCCESDYCNLNHFSAANVFSNRLQCSVCNSDTQNCQTNLQPMLCDEVSSTCVDIQVVDYLNGVKKSSSYIKGCGAPNTGDQCKNTYAFNTGSLQRNTLTSCCNTKLCNSNTGSFNPVYTNYNGIKCWGCLENGNNSCASPTPVSCQGTMLRCFEAFDQNRKTVMKGCSTVAFCSSTYLTDLPYKVSEIMCCAGSFCNNFTQQISNSTGTIGGCGISSRATSMNTDFRLIAFFIILLYATLRH